MSAFWAGVWSGTVLQVLLWGAALFLDRSNANAVFLCVLVIAVLPAIIFALGVPPKKQGPFLEVWKSNITYMAQAIPRGLIWLFVTGATASLWYFVFEILIGTP